ncbi:hypothetical protein BDQ17DRAFT_1334104 [Cyathus striatus]|nr:hypothetical protein BDQ17DRAFT_1334104 [Cyathus striatus]
MSPQLSDEKFQAYLDTYLGTVIVQAFLSGLYTFLFFRTVRAAVPKLQNGTHFSYDCFDVSIYLNYVELLIHLGGSSVDSDTKGGKQQSIAAQIIFGSSHMLEVVHGTQIAAMLIADTLLVWRCYMVWLKNKWLLVLFGILLLGEVVSRDSGSMGRYGYIIEILVESGIFYSTPLLITGVMLVFHDDITVTEAGTYLMAILIPVTGIAPTLISEHAMTNAKRDQERWSQPISTLRFRQATRDAAHQESDVTLSLPR